MNVPWPGKRCVLCRTEGLLTKEHLIPESIGGILTVHFLCQRCNSTLGQYEAHLKKDPSIRLAIGTLSTQLPALYASICEGQKFVAQSERGPAPGVYKQRQFRIRTAELPDGSLICPTEDRTLEEMLRGGGLEEAKITEALQKFESAPENTRVTVAEGFDVVKWSITSIDEALETEQCIVRFDGGEETLQRAGIALLKLAFEYLALHLGLAIFDSRFDPIREALKHNNPSLCQHRVERKRGSKLMPYHRLIVEKKPTHVVVQIRLFGELIYRVHFPHLPPGEGFERCTYTHDLTSNADCFEEV